MNRLKDITPYKEKSASGQAVIDNNLDKKEQVRDMFDNIAHRYDFLNHLLSFGIDHYWRWFAIRTLRKQWNINSVKENSNSKYKIDTILDLATGTGDLAFADLRLKPEKVIGVDISEGMLHIAKQKAEKRKLTNIEFQIGDGEKLEFEDNSLDMITVGFGLRNFNSLQKGLEEMFRVLAPGGLVAILEPSNSTLPIFGKIFAWYFRNVLPFIGKLFSKDARAYSYLPESVAAFPLPDEFKKISDSIGFYSKHFDLTFGTCVFYLLEKKASTMKPIRNIKKK